MSLSPAPPETESTSLREGRLGVVGIVFYVIAAASPLVGMTGALPVAIVLGNGAAVPGAYLAVGIVLLLFSVGYAAMSQRVTNTGAFFAYVGRGLGIGPGVGSAYVSLVAYLAIQLAIYGFFGAVMSSQMDAKLGIDLSWWVWTLLAWGVVLLLSAFSVDVGAKVLGVLMLLELASLMLVSIAVFVQGGPDGFDFAASFAPDNILVGGITGSAGIALAFAFASFIGFEATAIYGEESRDPKRTVPSRPTRRSRSSPSSSRPPRSRSSPRWVPPTRSKRPSSAHRSTASHWPTRRRSSSRSPPSTSAPGWRT